MFFPCSGKGGRRPPGAVLNPSWANAPGGRLPPRSDCIVSKTRPPFRQAQGPEPAEGKVAFYLSRLARQADSGGARCPQRAESVLRTSRSTKNQPAITRGLIRRRSLGQRQLS